VELGFRGTSDARPSWLMSSDAQDTAIAQQIGDLCPMRKCFGCVTCHAAEASAGVSALCLEASYDSLTSAADNHLLRVFYRVRPIICPYYAVGQCRFVLSHCGAAAESVTWIAGLACSACAGGGAADLKVSAM
jgi:hypothetical protein